MKRFHLLTSWREVHLFCSLFLDNFPWYLSKTAQPVKTYLTILGNQSPESGGLGAFLSLKRHSAGTARAGTARRSALRRVGREGKDVAGAGWLLGCQWLPGQPVWLRQASHPALPEAVLDRSVGYRTHLLEKATSVITKAELDGSVEDKTPLKAQIQVSNRTRQGQDSPETAPTPGCSVCSQSFPAHWSSPRIHGTKHRHSVPLRQHFCCTC